MGIISKYYKDEATYIDLDVVFIIMSSVTPVNRDFHKTKKVISFRVKEHDGQYIEDMDWEYIGSQLEKIFPTIYIERLDIKESDHLLFDGITYMFIPTAIAIYIENYKEFTRSLKIDSILK